LGFADVIRKEPGTVYMMSNEAIVRAALEADVKVVSFFPGAPQTEVLDTFEKAVTLSPFTTGMRMPLFWVSVP